MEPLPSFRYHPDPVRTGSIQPTAERCSCCERLRGFEYSSTPYGMEEDYEHLCPWCIANGLAHERLGVEFVDSWGIGAGGFWDDVPQSVREEIMFRTPGYVSWQSELWWTHCGDGGEFLGMVGAEAVRQYPGFEESLITYLTRHRNFPEAEVAEFLAMLSTEGSPTAYLFRCRHCGTHGGYADFA